jgi:hypothetical protein
MHDKFGTVESYTQLYMFSFFLFSLVITRMYSPNKLYKSNTNPDIFGIVSIGWAVQTMVLFFLNIDYVYILDTDVSKDGIAFIFRY